MRARHFTFPETGAVAPDTLWIVAALLLGAGVNCLAAIQSAARLCLFN